MSGKIQEPWRTFKNFQSFFREDRPMYLQPIYLGTCVEPERMENLMHLLSRWRWESCPDSQILPLPPSGTSVHSSCTAAVDPLSSSNTLLLSSSFPRYFQSPPYATYAQNSNFTSYGLAEKLKMIILGGLKTRRERCVKYSLGGSCFRRKTGTFNKYCFFFM